MRLIWRGFGLSYWTQAECIQSGAYRRKATLAFFVMRTDPDMFDGAPSAGAGVPPGEAAGFGAGGHAPSRIVAFRCAFSPLSLSKGTAVACYHLRLTVMILNSKIQPVI